MNIIRAAKDNKLFKPYLEDPKNSITLNDWANWGVALKGLYGLPIKKKRQIELFKQCTGRTKLPQRNFRKALFLVGRRGGKSKIAGLIAAFEGALSGREKKLSKGELGLISVISPSRFQSIIIKKYIRAAFATDMLEAEIVDDGDKKDYFVLSNGVRIQIMTGDFRTVRGFTQLAVIVDEICFFGVSDESKVKNDDELIQAIRPALLTTKGLLICISSKYAKRGWAYRTWKNNFGNNNGRVFVWDAPSLTMNSATLTQEDIDDEIADDPVANRTEYLNEWREDIAAYLPREVIEAVVVKGRKELLARPSIRYYGFVDVSGGRNDDAALAIAHKKETKVIVDFIKRHKPPHSPYEVIRLMCDELKRFGIKCVMGDNYSAEFVVSAFRKNGIKYIRSKLPKSALYLELLPRICSGEIELLDDDISINQLASLERRTRSGGKDIVDHPRGGHDDSANVIAGVSVASGKKKIWLGGGTRKRKPIEV